MADPIVGSPIYPVTTSELLEVAVRSLSNTPVVLFTGDLDMYYMRVDNSRNSAATFIKVYGSIGVTYDTDDPDHTFKIPAGAYGYIQANRCGDLATDMGLDVGLSVAASSSAALDGAAPAVTVDVTFGVGP